MENLISIKDLEKHEIEKIFKKTSELKGKINDEMRGKTLVMIFEKPSTRTRVSFENAMYQMGGNAIFMSPKDMQLSRGETIADTARTLSRYVNAIMARVFEHDKLIELDKFSDIPIINGLSDFAHPCQVLGDLFTVLELKGTLNLKFAWVGDGDNVCNSFVFAAEKLGFQLDIATPAGFEPKAIRQVRADNIRLMRSPVDAVRNADVVVTDTWTSMGTENEKAEREAKFRPFQVNEELVSAAKPNYLFMHCLPAHREEEVTAEIIDGEHSVVWQEAENRMHVQKAILSLLINK